MTHHSAVSRPKRRACFICTRAVSSPKLPIGAVTCWACTGLDALADRQLVREGVDCPTLDQVRARAQTIRAHRNRSVPS